METTALLPLVESACRYLLSAQDRDPFSPSYGCFDRRYWGWKLIDFPEATFQRNVYPLAWYLKNCRVNADLQRVLAASISASLQFAVKIQHNDGSFDQAFPNEHSFGATAFLVHPMLEALRIVSDHLADPVKKSFRDMLYRSAEFLCRHKETHGHIANHLAGGALSLYTAADFFSEPKFSSHANALIWNILQHQSSEGWFMEYEGADPGYQSLCMYYLAQVYRLHPTPELRTALERAVNFLSHFVHPDGTYGGEYGSRRTAIYYPGGLALLAGEFPLAVSMTRAMLRSIEERRTITVQDVDMGNLAPLLSSYLPALDAEIPEDIDMPLLPCEQDSVRADFPEAGLFVRGTSRYYAVMGASNGGVLKIFSRSQRTILWNDAGYAGQDKKRRWLTTQMTVLDRPITVTEDAITVEAPFYIMRRELPDPLRFVLLRVLNLTIMRSIALGNWVKGILTNLLIVGKDQLPLSLKRMVVFSPASVEVRDSIWAEASLELDWLSYGRPFVSIHMASAKYFENEGASNFDGRQVQVDELNERRMIEMQVTI
jgi:hypothetical protein